MPPARGRTTRAWRSRIGGAQTEKPGRPRRGVIGAPRLNDGQIVVPRGATTHTPNGRSSSSPDGGSIAAAFCASMRCGRGTGGATRERPPIHRGRHGPGHGTGPGPRRRDREGPGQRHPTGPGGGGASPEWVRRAGRKEIGPGPLMGRPADCCDGKGAAGFPPLMRQSGQINTRGARSRARLEPREREKGPA
jgi:hypothetical protein